MKIKLPPFLQNAWLVLTEVPGWADAPFMVRLSRTLPIALPCGGLAFLLIWNLGWHRPEVRAIRAANAPLVALEAEIASLQRNSSEQQAQELAGQAGDAARLLFALPADVAPFLQSLKQEAAGHGWEATFHPGETAEMPDTDGVVMLSVRGKLAPAPGNRDPYGSLLALLERLNAAGQRTDLLRLAIRANEQSWQSVELNLRLLGRSPHAKAP